MKQFLLIVFFAALMVGCESRLKKENEALQQELTERREALKEHQEQSLDDARRDMAVTDSLLEEATRQHDELHQWVMTHASELNDHSPQVVQLNALRARCDSLKERFSVLAETIKYILKKQKE